jgi:fucose permease
VRSSAGSLVVLASLAFIGLGLPDGVLGVAWPSMRVTFGLSLDALGALLVSFTSGYVASSFAGGRLTAALGLGLLLALSCLATGVAFLGYVAAWTWWAVVACGTLAGAGAGGIDAGINAYAALNHGPRMLNWLHACYGVGAVAGPVLMTSILASGLGWQRGYLMVAAAQVALAAGFASTIRRWPRADSQGDRTTAAARLQETLALRVTWMGIGLFVLYTGIEAATGVWAFTVLTERRALDMMSAGTWTALYWSGLTAGRLLGAAAAAVVPVRMLVRAATLVLGTGLLLFASAEPARLYLAGLVLAGIGAGPVFPSLIASTPARVGYAHASNAVGFQIAAAAIGQSVVPWIAGAIGDSFGLAALAWTLPVGAAGVIVLHEWMIREGHAQRDRTRRR